jgi:FKBP-type peptidyl-prolyl cis-trans isomerase SlpA
MGAPVESKAVYASRVGRCETSESPAVPTLIDMPSPVVQPGSFLTLHYRLAGPDGADVVNTFLDKPATLSLGAGQLAPAIEARLMGLSEGAHESFDLAAGEAFGARNPDMLQRVKLALLHELGDADASYAVGDAVHFPTPDGRGSYAGVVREVGTDWLLFDFNHPLAGQPVRFEVKLLGVL